MEVLGGVCKNALIEAFAVYSSNGLQMVLPPSSFLQIVDFSFGRSTITEIAAKKEQTSADYYDILCFDNFIDITS